MKNLTRLWPGSSSTLTGNKRKQAQNKNKRQHSTNEAAPKAVRELSAMGGKSGTRKAGSPDSLQSENPGTREKRNQKGKRREQSSRTSQRTKEEKREQI